MFANENIYVVGQRIIIMQPVFIRILMIRNPILNQQFAIFIQISEKETV